MEQYDFGMDIINNSFKVEGDSIFTYDGIVFIPYVNSFLYTVVLMYDYSADTLSFVNYLDYSDIAYLRILYNS